MEEMVQYEGNYKSNSKKRNSSIEVLKILGLILIVLSHAVPFYGDSTNISYINLNLATKNIEEFIFIIFRNLGQIGNIIFIMCSSYFLIDSKKVNIKKIVQIILDCFIISIIYLLIYLLFRRKYFYKRNNIPTISNNF